MNKKIAIVIDSTNSANGLLINKILPYLCENNTVYLFTIKNDKQIIGLKNLNLIQLDSALNTINNNINNLKATKLKNIMFKINKLIRGTFSSLFWLGQFKWYARKTENKLFKLDKKNNFDIIFAVCYPFSGLYGAYRFSKRKNKCLVSVIFDYYSKVNNSHKYSLFKKYFIKKDLKMENKIFKYSEKILMSQNLSDEYLKIYSNLKITGFPIIDESIYIKNSLNQLDNNPVMFYGGAFKEGVRNPLPLLEVMNLLKDQPISLNICHIGDYSSLIKKFSKYCNINDFGARPYEFVQEKIIESQILINIGNENEVQIPSKLFEYIATGKPIVNFYKNNICNKILEGYPLHLNIDAMNINRDIAQEIYDFCINNLNKRVDYNFIQSIYKNYTIKNYVENIIEIVEKTNNKVEK